MGRIQFLESILADSSGSARRVLSRLNIDALTLLAAARSATPVLDEEVLWTPAADRLKLFGGVLAARRPILAKFLFGGLRAVFLGPGYAQPVLLTLELESVRQAVRLGHSQVTSAHMVLAILTLAEQLTSLGLTLPADQVGVNGAEKTLANCGVGFAAALKAVPAPPSAEQSASAQRRRPWRTHPRYPPWTIAAAAAADEAREMVSGAGVRVGASHLLVALLADSEGPGAQLLRVLGADPVEIAAEVKEQISLR